MILRMVLCLVVGGWAFMVTADERSDVDALRSTYEDQFEQIDSNQDGQLDDAELKKMSTADLQALRRHGLPTKLPVPRDAFVAAGVKLATAVPTSAAEPVDHRDAANSGRDADEPATLTVVPVRSDESVKPVDSSRPEATKTDPGKSTGTKTTPEVTVTKPARNPRKSHFVPELPAEYSPRDKNGDGQIALYEWDRKKFAEFAKLDKNSDGFLTPAELLPKGALKTLYAKTPTRSGAAGGKTASAEKSASGNDADDVDKEARKTFGEMDEKKDGAIDESDWGRSRRIRPWFESVGIKVSLPMNTETFVANFRLAKESQGR